LATEASGFAQLVAEHRQELVLGAVRGAQRLLGRLLPVLAVADRRCRLLERARQLAELVHRARIGQGERLALAERRCRLGHRPDRPRQAAGEPPGEPQAEAAGDGEAGPEQPQEAQVGIDDAGRHRHRYRPAAGRGPLDGAVDRAAVEQLAAGPAVGGRLDRLAQRRAGKGVAEAGRRAAGDEAEVAVDHGHRPLRRKFLPVDDLADRRRIDHRRQHQVDPVTAHDREADREQRPSRHLAHHDLADDERAGAHHPEELCRARGPLRCGAGGRQQAHHQLAGIGPRHLEIDPLAAARLEGAQRLDAERLELTAIEAGLAGQRLERRGRVVQLRLDRGHQRARVVAHRALQRRLLALGQHVGAEHAEGHDRNQRRQGQGAKAGADVHAGAFCRKVAAAGRLCVRRRLDS
jgi:hypothetical protein